MVLLFWFSLSNYPEDCVNSTISSAALELLFLINEKPLSLVRDVFCLKLYIQEARECVSVCHITWYNRVLLDDLVWHILIIRKEFPLWGTCWQGLKLSECYDRWLFISFLISGSELIFIPALIFAAPFSPLLLINICLDICWTFYKSAFPRTHQLGD